jgi:hypothetical protein
MGAIKFPHTSGNSMSISAPATNPASDLELKLPATIGTANQVLRNSSTPGTLEFATPSSQAGKDILAWVNFNGTGTVAIRDHYNVSSITDVGTGHYTVNFASDLPDANYATIVTADGVYNGTSATLGHNDNDTSHTAVGSVKVESRGFNSAALADAETYCVACIS